MKKIVSIVLIAALLSVAVFALTGCEKKEKAPTLVGSWKNDEMGYDFIYTFNEDGTGKYDAAGTIMDFTYTTDGDNISILYDGDTVSFDTTYHLDGDTLNVVDSIGNDTLYQRVK